MSEQQPSSDNMNNSLLGKSGSGGTISSEEESSLITKSDLLSQLDPTLREQLSPRIWEIINYHPLKLYIAHREHKQIILASIKNNKIQKHDPFTNLDLTSEINSINLSKIIIGAIPTAISRHEDPLELTKENKYTIKFETQIETQSTFTLGPSSLDEIIQQLHNRTLVLDQNKATEALSAIILSMEKDNRVIVNKEITTPGYYLIDGQIKASNNNKYNHPNPSKEEIAKCVELLELLQQRFKTKDIFPTILKWSIAAPFNYVMKQANRDSWMSWLYLYGFPRTGKTTLGYLESAIWGNRLDKDRILPFTNVDTNAKLGEALSKSTYPLLINETGSLSEESKFTNKSLIEMIKTAIEGPIARSKFLHKTIYTEIPSFCACIFTSNSAPPSDLGFRRRIIAIPFAQNDEYTVEERKEFEKLLKERIAELKVLGDFSSNYILKNQDLILDDTNKKNWDEIAKLVLCEMYKIIEREPPEWIEYRIDSEIQFQENKEEVDLILRSFLINKINEVYIRYHKSIDPISSVDGINQPFDFRMDFCLKHNLIPFLNTNSKSEIIITTDLIQELKNHRIYGISSLQEVANIIDGFEYGQKKFTGRNLRAASGSRKQFSDFFNL